MERYKNIGGDSGVTAYETGRTLLESNFLMDPSTYTHTLNLDLKALSA